MKADALGEVINKIRLGKDWTPLVGKNQVAAVAVYMEVLDKAGARFETYNELYNRAEALRTRRFAEGRDAPDHSPALLASFVGEVNAEWMQNAKSGGRTLQAGVALNCPKCFGGGIEIRIIEGRRVAGGQCDHARTVEQAAAESAHGSIDEKAGVAICYERAGWEKPKNITETNQVSSFLAGKLKMK